jgi:[ribosomal protein S5]-alanine N-acetyltransferase
VEGRVNSLKNVPEFRVMKAMKAPILSAHRLTLEPYAYRHLDPMAEMFGDHEVTAFTYLGRQDLEGTARVLAEYRAFHEANGYGMYAILDRETGAYYGEAGLFVPPAVASAEHLALRYALARSAWGKGIATEASAAVIDDAFGRLGKPAIIAGVVPHNLPSMRVMDRLGFSRGPEVTSGAHTYAVFTLTREAWRSRER